MPSRAQSSVEFLVLTSFLLVVVGILFIYSFGLVDDAITFSKAQNAVESIASASDSVGSLSAGSRKIVSVELPNGVTSFGTMEKEVYIHLVRGDKVNDFWAETKNDLDFASFPTDKGIYQFKAFLSDDGNVLISQVT